MLYMISVKGVELMIWISLLSFGQPLLETGESFTVALDIPNDYDSLANDYDSLAKSYAFQTPLLLLLSSSLKFSL